MLNADGLKLPTFPPASSRSLPRSSGEDRPLRCPRCGQSCWRRLQTRTLRPLPPPLLPWPSEPPRPRIRPVSPLPPRRCSRQRPPAPCGSDANSISPISLSRPCPWVQDPQNLNSNPDSLPPLQPLPPQSRPRPDSPHPRRSLPRPLPLPQALPPQLSPGNLFPLRSSLVRPRPPTDSTRSQLALKHPQALPPPMFPGLCSLNHAQMNHAQMKNPRPLALPKLSHWPPSLLLPAVSQPQPQSLKLR